MNQTNDIETNFEIAARALLWCFGLSILVLVFWFGMIALLGDTVYGFHSKFSPISRPQFDVVHYAGMALFKIGAFGLFLFPYVGIRMALKARRR